MQKEVLCFGDSNVFGYNPSDGSRYPVDIRWSGLVKEYFKNKLKIVEAGCNNRTIFENPNGKNYSGIDILKEYLLKKYFGIVFLIGINDFQNIYTISDETLYLGLENLILISRKIVPDIKILLLCPNKLDDRILSGPFSLLFDKKSISKSQSVEKIYSNIAKKYKTDYINLNDFVKTSSIDGLHYDVNNHKIIFSLVKNIIDKWIYN